MAHRLLVIQVAGLGYEFLAEQDGDGETGGLRFQPMQTVFPALTCPVQASFRTAAAPCEHGMVFNGTYSRELRKPSFWEQSSALVEGPRIWEGLGERVGLLFWQQSLGEDVGVLLSPAPIHKHHGGMIDALYSRPAGLYDELCRRVGRRFKLRSYWGPLASAASSRWIADATGELMAMPDAAPDLLLTYLPHLDYALLQHGPAGSAAARAFAELAEIVGALRQRAEAAGYEVVVFGDYAFADVSRPLYPNRVLREAGLFQTREVRGMLYPDFHASRAFAVVDHEAAFVYVQDAGDLREAAGVLGEAEGVEEVLMGEALVERGIAHPRCSEIAIVAEPGAWFAYPWWTERREQPDYATHVDIHNKPGFDPCELFLHWLPFDAAADAARIGGSHGRVGEGREVAWAATCDLGCEPADLIELAAAVRRFITGGDP